MKSVFLLKFRLRFLLIAPRGKLPLPPVRAGVWDKVSFGVGGAIFLGGNCIRTFSYSNLI